MPAQRAVRAAVWLSLAAWLGPGAAEQRAPVLSGAGDPGRRCAPCAGFVACGTLTGTAARNAAPEGGKLEQPISWRFPARPQRQRRRRRRRHHRAKARVVRDRSMRARGTPGCNHVQPATTPISATEMESTQCAGRKPTFAPSLSPRDRMYRLSKTAFTT